jgi:hypothetical protein
MTGYCILAKQQQAAAARLVANDAPCVGRADACFEIASARRWQPLTVARMLRPRRAVLSGALALGHPCEGGRPLDRSAATDAVPWKQCCSTSTPTSSGTGFRTAPAVQRSRARRRGARSSSKRAAGVSRNSSQQQLLLLRHDGMTCSSVKREATAQGPGRSRAARIWAHARVRACPVNTMAALKRALGMQRSGRLCRVWLPRPGCRFCVWSISDPGVGFRASPRT